MCYLIAKRMNKTGCVALQTEPGEEMAKFADEIQERLGYDIEIITISRPTAYGVKPQTLPIIITNKTAN